MVANNILRTLPVFALLVLSCGKGHAQTEQGGLPTGVCAGGRCAPHQAGIWRRFKIAAAPNLEWAPALFSGHCYHDAKGLNPNSAEFGGVLIDRQGSRLLFNAKFSFHVKEHPYAHLDVPGARKRFALPYPAKHEVTLNDSFASVEATNALAPFKYWFREQPEADGILLVGYFGFSHTILCDLRRHT